MNQIRERNRPNRESAGCSPLMHRGRGCAKLPVRVPAARAQAVRAAREPEEGREGAAHAVFSQRHRCTNSERLVPTHGLGVMRFATGESAGEAASYASGTEYLKSFSMRREVGMEYD